MKHLFAFGRKVVHRTFKNSAREPKTDELEKVSQEGVKAKKPNALKRKGKFWSRRIGSDWDSGNPGERLDTM
ncbi:MAG: hypothetical protein E2O41_00175 [Nitrospina sp.]|nr:MAG: hypothetical protein E2O41_00175 [Nitrospina sp.]